MSFDFFPNENAATMLRASRMPSLTPEPGTFTGFSQVPSMIMEGFAKTGRAIDLLGAVGPIAMDAITGGYEETDRYFREHDEIFNRAVDYWTPPPNSVGTAGKVIGSVIPVLMEYAVSPVLPLVTAIGGTAEDLTKQGVSPGKAVGAGVVQGTGLALGMYLPIFGNTLAMRTLVAGAGANVVQGVATRAATAAVLSGEKAAAQYDPWESEAMAIDLMMGLGFGAMTHMAKAPGESAMKDMQALVAAREALTATDKAAILTGNQVRHLESTTAPGIPKTDVDRTLHAEAMTKAVDDILNGRVAEVGQLLQDAKFAPDEAKIEFRKQLEEQVSIDARIAIMDEMARVDRISAAEGTPGFLRTADDMLALKSTDPVFAKELQEAIDIAKRPGFQRSASEKVTLDRFIYGRGAEILMRQVPDLPPKIAEPPKPLVAPTFAENLKAKLTGKEPPEGGMKGPAVTKPVDPVVAEAEARLAARPDMTIDSGIDRDGNPVSRSLGDDLKATSEAVARAEVEAPTLMQTAAQCLLGAV